MSYVPFEAPQGLTTRCPTLERKNGTDAAIVWIKDPQPPMPKLYPKPRSDKDVDDIIVYLESL